MPTMKQRISRDQYPSGRGFNNVRHMVKAMPRRMVQRYFRSANGNGLIIGKAVVNAAGIEPVVSRINSRSACTIQPYCGLIPLLNQGCSGFPSPDFASKFLAKQMYSARMVRMGMGQKHMRRGDTRRSTRLQTSCRISSCARIEHYPLVLKSQRKHVAIKRVGQIEPHTTAQNQSNLVINFHRKPHDCVEAIHSLNASK